MNPKKYMVIDTSRLGTPKMFITKQVAHLEIADGMWHITFETSPISYTYRYELNSLRKSNESTSRPVDST